MAFFLSTDSTNQLNVLREKFNSSILKLDKKGLWELIFRAYFYDYSEKFHDPTERAKQALASTKKVFNQNQYSFQKSGLNPVIPVPIPFTQSFGVQKEFFTEFAINKKQYFGNFLVSLIGNPLALNYCFFSEGPIIDGPNFSYNHSSGLDFEGIQKVYDHLFTLEKEDKDLTLRLSESLKKTSDSILQDILNKKLKTGFDLRKFMIILFYKGLMEFNQGTTLFNLFKAATFLEDGLDKILVNWYAECPKDMLLSVIKTVQNFLTLQIYSTYVIDRRIMFGVKFLDILHRANQTRTPNSNQIPDNEFYNDPINSIVDLKEDTFRWMELKSKTFNSKEFGSFSFIQHPFILEPASKRDCLGHYAQRQQFINYSNTLVNGILSGNLQASPVLVLRVHRNNLIQTALSAIDRQRNNLRRPLQVKFEGTGEDGVDEGGLTREFFALIMEAIFDVNYGMFKYDSDSRTFWFNPHSFTGLESFNLIGTVIGLALFNSTILNLHFPFLLYKKILGCPLTLEDLEEADPNLGKGLRQLLEYEGDDVEDVFGMMFSVETMAFGQVHEHELIPGGKDIPVTNANRQQYVDALIDWKYNKSIEKQFDAFVTGFKSVIETDLLDLFTPTELELLVCGSKVLDFDQLEKSTKYGEGYTPDSDYIKQFWKIVHALTKEEKKKFLSFCTGSDRSPIRGLKELKFAVVRTGEIKSLPSAMTCYNTLILPQYLTVEELEKKLKTAIQHSSGFGLK